MLNEEEADVETVKDLADKNAQIDKALQQIFGSIEKQAMKAADVKSEGIGDAIKNALDPSKNPVLKMINKSKALGSIMAALGLAGKAPPHEVSLNSMVDGLADPKPGVIELISDYIDPSTLETIMQLVQQTPMEETLEDQIAEAVMDLLDEGPLADKFKDKDGNLKPQLADTTTSPAGGDSDKGDDQQGSTETDDKTKKAMAVLNQVLKNVAAKGPAEAINDFREDKKAVNTYKAAVAALGGEDKVENSLEGDQQKQFAKLNVFWEEVFGPLDSPIDSSADNKNKVDDNKLKQINKAIDSISKTVKDPKGFTSYFVGRTDGSFSVLKSIFLITSKEDMEKTQEVDKNAVLLRTALQAKYLDKDMQVAQPFVALVYNSKKYSLDQIEAVDKQKLEERYKEADSFKVLNIKQFLAMASTLKQYKNAAMVLSLKNPENPVLNWAGLGENGVKAIEALLATKSLEEFVKKYKSTNQALKMPTISSGAFARMKPEEILDAVKKQFSELDETAPSDDKKVVPHLEKFLKGGEEQTSELEVSKAEERYGQALKQFLDDNQYLVVVKFLAILMKAELIQEGPLQDAWKVLNIEQGWSKVLKQAEADGTFTKEERKVLISVLKDPEKSKQFVAAIQQTEKEPQGKEGSGEDKSIGEFEPQELMNSIVVFVGKHNTNLEPDPEGSAPQPGARPNFFYPHDNKMSSQAKIIHGLYAQMRKVLKLDPEDLSRQLKAFNDESATTPDKTLPADQPQQNESILREKKFDPKRAGPENFVSLRNYVQDTVEAVGEYKQTATKGMKGSQSLYNKYKAQLGGDARNPKDVLYKLLLPNVVNLANALAARIEFEMKKRPSDKEDEETTDQDPKAAETDDKQVQKEVIIEGAGDDYLKKVEQIKAVFLKVSDIAPRLYDTLEQYGGEDLKPIKDIRSASQSIYTELEKIREFFPLTKPFESELHGTKGFDDALKRTQALLRTVNRALVPVSTFGSFEDMKTASLKPILDALDTIVDTIQEVFSGEFDKRPSYNDETSYEDHQQSIKKDTPATDDPKDEEEELEQAKQELDEPTLQLIEDLEVQLKTYGNFYNTLQLFMVAKHSQIGIKSGDIQKLLSFLKQTSSGKMTKGEQFVTRGMARLKTYQRKFERFTDRTIAKASDARGLKTKLTTLQNIYKNLLGKESGEVNEALGLDDESSKSLMEIYTLISEYLAIYQAAQFILDDLVKKDPDMIMKQKQVLSLYKRDLGLKARALNDKIKQKMPNGETVADVLIKALEGAQIESSEDIKVIVDKHKKYYEQLSQVRNKLDDVETYKDLVKLINLDKAVIEVPPELNESEDLQVNKYKESLDKYLKAYNQMLTLSNEKSDQKDLEQAKLDYDTAFENIKELNKLILTGKKIVGINMPDAPEPEDVTDDAKLIWSIADDDKKFFDQAASKIKDIEIEDNEVREALQGLVAALIMTGQLTPGKLGEDMKKGQRQKNYTFLSAYLVDFVDIESDVKFDVLERFINPAHAEKLAKWVKDNQQQVKAIFGKSTDSEPEASDPQESENTPMRDILKNMSQFNLKTSEQAQSHIQPFKDSNDENQKNVYKTLQNYYDSNDEVKSKMLPDPTDDETKLINLLEPEFDVELDGESELVKAIEKEISPEDIQNIIASDDQEVEIKRLEDEVVTNITKLNIVSPDDAEIAVEKEIEKQVQTQETGDTPAPATYVLPPERTDAMLELYKNSNIIKKKSVDGFFKPNLPKFINFLGELKFDLEEKKKKKKNINSPESTIGNLSKLGFEGFDKNKAMEKYKNHPDKEILGVFLKLFAGGAAKKLKPIWDSIVKKDSSKINQMRKNKMARQAASPSSAGMAKAAEALTNKLKPIIREMIRGNYG